MAFRPLSSYSNTALTIISTLEREHEDLLSFLIVYSLCEAPVGRRFQWT